jgi:hypothetical protein
VYPEGATCEDINADTNVTSNDILNCTESPNSAYAFAVDEPLAFSRNVPEVAKINGSNYFEALDLCCEKVHRVPAWLPHPCALWSCRSMQLTQQLLYSVHIIGGGLYSP